MTKIQKILNTLLLILSVTFSADELAPYKKNALLLNENEIKCIKTGDYSFTINNYQNKKYFHLIKDTIFKQLELFEEDAKLYYETNTDYDYFYKINPNKILYLVINFKSDVSYCFSYKFSDFNYISFNNNEEYLYPFLKTSQFIETTIRNVANKHFIFYFKHSWNTNPKANYNIYINNVKYYPKSGNNVFSLIIKEDAINVKIYPPTERLLVNLTYISVPYSNVSDNTIICKEDSYYSSSYFINKPKKKASYFYYSLSSDKIEYFENNELKTELKRINTYFSVHNWEYFILMKDKGCFQLKYTNETQNIKIGNNDSFLISTPETYYFKYVDNSRKNMNISIYSTENNFIKNMVIDGIVKNLSIQNNNYSYFYTFISSNNDGSIALKISFNIRNYIIIDFKIEYYIPNPIQKEPEKDSDNTTVYYVLGGIGIVIFVVITIILIIKIYKCRKESKEFDESLLKRYKFIDLIGNFYDLIKRNPLQIEKVCLICLNEGEFINTLNTSYIFEEDNESSIIDDINDGNFKSFLNYIKPDHCRHLYHIKCLNGNNKIRRNINDCDNCPLCRMFITSKNLKNFGCFFSKSFLQDLIDSDMKKYLKNYKKNYDYFDYNEKDAYINKFNKKRKDFFVKLKDIFYSKIEHNKIIKGKYLNNLIKIKNLNEKYKEEFRQYEFNYKDLDINSNVDEIENELKKVIREREEERKLERQKRKIYEDDDEDDNDDKDDDEKYIPTNSNNNIHNYNNRAEKIIIKRNRQFSWGSQGVTVYLCKECSRHNCFFCKSKKGMIQMMAKVHQKCCQKNQKKHCFICYRAVEIPNALPITRYCHDCERSYKNIRKLCPVCRKEIDH